MLSLLSAFLCWAVCLLLSLRIIFFLNTALLCNAICLLCSINIRCLPHYFLMVISFLLNKCLTHLFAYTLFSFFKHYSHRHKSYLNISYKNISFVILLHIQIFFIHFQHFYFFLIFNRLAPRGFFIFYIFSFFFAVILHIFNTFSKSLKS